MPDFVVGTKIQPRALTAQTDPLTGAIQGVTLIFDILPPSGLPAGQRSWTYTFTAAEQTALNALVQNALAAVQSAMVAK